VSDAELEVEASGETVGEAKWVALRELEKLQPSLDKSAVSFQVVSEGQRGLLGVGYSPARVIARVDATAAVVRAPEPPREESALAAQVRDVVERIAGEIAGRVRVDVVEDEESMAVSIHGGDLGLVIGKHGQTIDAIQYLVNAIVSGAGEERKPVVVDAGGYRERRRATVESMAVRAAERAVSGGRAVELEPMTAIERKLVHERLKEYPGVATRSEGAEPTRFVVVGPAPTPADGSPG
jgi:spoIIIJ-associated protein